MKNKKIFGIKIAVFIVVLIGYGVSALFFRTQIDRALNLAKYGAADIAEIKGEGASKEGFAAAGNLKVHYVDVGQGDATVIELPDDKTMVIDGGPEKKKSQFFTYMENSLPKVDGFDYVILTHSDADHCEGLDDIINKFPVKENGRIYRPNQVSNYKDYTDPALSKTGIEGFWGNYTEYEAGKNTLAYKKFIEAAYNQSAANVKVWVTDANNPAMNILGDLNGNGTYDDGTDYLITFYGPTKAAWKDVNDYSTIFSLDYQGKRLMFTGDSEEKGEESFAKDIAAGKFSFDKPADVIKLGHHGSRTSTSDAYLKTVLPSLTDNPFVLAIVSCGAGNSYGHPHTETLNRLINDYKFKEENILRTDIAGTIVLAVSDGKLMYGAVEIVQDKGFEPLSWVVIGAAIVVVIFILLFATDIYRKTKKPQKTKQTHTNKRGEQKPNTTPITINIKNYHEAPKPPKEVPLTKTCKYCGCKNKENSAKCKNCAAPLD